MTVRARESEIQLYWRDGPDERLSKKISGERERAEGGRGAPRLSSGISVVKGWRHT